LAAVAEAAIGGDLVALSSAERYQTVIHVDADALADAQSERSDAESGRCQLDDSPALAPETVRRLLCDGAFASIVERNGKPLRIGRKTRAIPPALRRALCSRDRSCRFPGCERHRFTDAHHIRHWAHGGETNLDNLVLLCRYHHRLLHEGGFSVERTPRGALAFRHRGGWRIPVVPRAPGSDPAQLLAQNRHLGLGIDHETCLTGTGERMDLGMAVDAALAATDSSGPP